MRSLRQKYLDQKYEKLLTEPAPNKSSWGQLWVSAKFPRDESIHLSAGNTLQKLVFDDADVDQGDVEP